VEHQRLGFAVASDGLIGPLGGGVERDSDEPLSISTALAWPKRSSERTSAARSVLRFSAGINPPRLRADDRLRRRAQAPHSTRTYLSECLLDRACRAISKRFVEGRLSGEPAVSRSGSDRGGYGVMRAAYTVKLPPPARITRMCAQVPVC
jgi:hypothetical protein